MRKAALLFLILLIGCSSAESGDVDFSTLAREDTAAGISGRVNEVFTDPVSFETFWESIYRGQDPLPDPPKVDFSQDMVIAVSSGEMPTGGYDVKIVKVVKDKERLEVTIVTDKPSSDFVTQSLTEPHHIIKLKKVNLPIVYKWMEQ